jgi:MFS transporter, ACS family, glucarate transporter
MNADPTRPTNVRYLIVAVTAMAALWMYIDRVCFSTLAPAVGKDLNIDDDDMAYVLGAFFFTYALFQFPIGSLADRFGARVVLTVSIIAWSLCTAATALAWGATALLTVRLCLGVCESGAYPSAVGLIRRWASTEERGRLSGIVSFGGRIGGAVAPYLTVFAAIALLGIPSPDDASKKQENWRGVFLLYGALGIVTAVVFWLFVRDHPRQHAWSNAAEAERVPPAQAAAGHSLTIVERLGALLSSRNMWLFGGMQFFVNVGWVFVVANYPKYLEQRFQVAPEDRSTMQTVTLLMGCVGMAIGGFYADFMYRRLGPRWGRSLPVGIVLFICAMTYIIATQLPTAWGVAVALGMMAFCVDLAIPTMWAFAQDVGGRYSGAALGWGNMIGNFGAAVSPVTLRFIRKLVIAETDDQILSWNVAFFCCSAAFVLAGVCALSLNALIPLARKRLDPEAEDYREP